MLSATVASGIEATNKLLHNILQHLSKEEQQDTAKQHLEKFVHPKEREAKERLRVCGAPNTWPKTCLDHDDALEALVRLDLGPIVERQKDNKLEIKSAIEDLKVQLGGKLDHNFAETHRKLDAIQGRLPAQGAYVDIDDKIIKPLWHDMNWRNHVKSHHFALALRDYIIRNPACIASNPKSNDASSIRSGAPSLQARQQVVVGEDCGVELLTLLTVAPIAESIDDDGTGFITTREVNEFVSSRPEYLNAMDWLIYWGEEWYASLAHYRTKILRTMQKMYAALDDLHLSNRYSVDRYLFTEAFRRIELLMRGLDTSRPYTQNQLPSRIARYTREEEEGLKRRLEISRYYINDQDMLTAVKGSNRRVERHLFPLLYLMLRYHLAIIRSGREYQVDLWSLYPAWTSLETLMDAATERAATLDALLRYSKTDGRARLSTYAFGMLQYLVDSEGDMVNTAEENLLRLYYDSDDEEEVEISTVVEDLDLEVIPTQGDAPGDKEDYKAYHRNAWCDSCGDMIVGNRYACIQCTKDGLKNQLDLCTDCQEQTPEVESTGLVHKSSHTLAIIRFHLHDLDKKKVYGNARKALERVKRIAGSLIGSPDNEEKATPRSCVECEKSIVAPCTYCSTCYATPNQPDVFACQGCFQKREKHQYPSHVWILVKEEALRPKLSAVELQLKGLEQQLDKMRNDLERILQPSTV
ncbi:hypothetical protein EV714DRAFT_277869 [Schizophyllum commune]